jgi:FkbM family methyltransferase
MKRMINHLLRLMGYRISKIQTDRHSTQAMRSAVQRLSEKYQINTIIDVGASNGIWSRSTMDFYPESKYLLVEANPVHAQALDAFSTEKPNAQFVLAAAGDKQGGSISFSFDKDDPYAGQASYTPGKNSNTIPETSIDFEVDARKMKGPYLMKLDTHGFELPIFNGASATLAKTEIIIVECYNFKISSECLLFYEMCEYLGARGFRCIDLVDPLWRPYDNAFWQMDLIFIRKDSPQFLYSNYK